MLSPLHELIQGYRVILASSSAQRKSILQQIGLKFTAIPSSFDEESVRSEEFASPQEFVKHLARCKGSAVADVLRKECSEKGEKCSHIVIGADTVIVDGQNVIGKPHTREKAIETLSMLSGRKHKVCTGVAVSVFSTDEDSVSEDLFVTVTEVNFAPLKKETIVSYAETGEPLNKAGSYGIQGLGATLIESINGDYYNVVGFPVQEFCHRLTDLLQNRSS